MSKAKHALVTGANRGLGYATALALVKQGYTVWLGARNQQKAENAVSQMASELSQTVATASMHPLALDVSDSVSVSAALKHLQSHDAAISVLINNAGAIVESDVAPEAIDAELIAQALNINSLGAYRLIQALLPTMNAQGFGRIVNISSGMGAMSDMGAGWPAYRISKAALNAITLIFAHQTRGDVKINAVCPGWVRTDMGGPTATRSVDEGIAGIVWAATLPSEGPSGGFFRDGKAIAW